MNVANILPSRGTDLEHGKRLHCVTERDNQTESAELAEILAKKRVNVNTYRYDNDTARPVGGMFKL
jgi:hypothetical protein